MQNLKCVRGDTKGNLKRGTPRINTLKIGQRSIKCRVIQYASKLLMGQSSTAGVLKDRA